MGKLKTQEEMFLNKKRNEIHVGNQQEQVAQERMIELQDMSCMEQNSQTISGRAFARNVGGNAELSVPREASRKGSKKRQRVLEEQIHLMNENEEIQVRDDQVQENQVQDDSQVEETKEEKERKAKEAQEKKIFDYDKKLVENMNTAMEKTAPTGILTDEQVVIYQKASKIQSEFSKINRALADRISEKMLSEYSSSLVETNKAIVDIFTENKNLDKAYQDMFQAYQKEFVQLNERVKEREREKEKDKKKYEKMLKEYEKFQTYDFLSLEYRMMCEERKFLCERLLDSVKEGTDKYDEIINEMNNHIGEQMKTYIKSLEAKGKAMTMNERRELQFFAEQHPTYFTLDESTQKFQEEKKEIITRSNITRKERSVEKYKVFEYLQQQFEDSKALEGMLAYLDCAKTSDFYTKEESEKEKEAFAEVKKRIEVELSEENLTEQKRQMLQSCSAYLQSISQGTLQQDASVKEYDFTKGQHEFVFNMEDGVDSEGNKKYKDLSMKDRKEDPLFVHEPCISDIKQGALGDCYFVASLAAVVEKDPSYIRQHMRDNAEQGTVTVRFYEQGKPVDITVPKKTAVSSDGSDAYARGALWVQLYETAYAAFRLQFSKEEVIEQATDLIIVESEEERLSREARNRRNREKNRNRKKFLDEKKITMQFIAGGREMNALGHITGQNAERHLIGEVVKAKPLNKAVEDFIKRKNGNDPYAVMERYFAGRNNARATREQRRAKDNYVSQLKNIQKRLVKAKSLEEFDKIVGTLDLQNEIPTYQVPGYDMMKSEEIKVSIVTKFVVYCRDLFMRNKHILNEAYSGNYGVYADDVYNEIADHQANHQIMTAGTRLLEEEEKGLNGEGVIKGVAGGHAYSLLGVKQIGRYKYVKLRNPWAQSSRVVGKVEGSDAIKTEVKDDRDGIFLLELNDYIKYFNEITVLSRLREK